MADMEGVKKKIIEKFAINDLNSHQEKAIDALMKGNDVFVGTKTGSGKSLIYESAPLALKETGVTTVLAPLTSIMTEQVERLQRLGYRATLIRGDTDIEAVMNGYYQFVFGSPETLVGDPKWREILKTDTFSSKHQLIVVDEAHTVVQWGVEHDHEAPFREWFAQIGELRSLCINVPMLALTATASPTHRRQIMQKLCIKKNVTVIVDSPDRSNIKISVQKMKNNVDIEDIFRWMMTGLMERRQDYPRHIIFCNSIKDCASIYMLFYRNCAHDLFNMYHSKTTEKTKETIRADMGNPNGRIRVLICTNAAGMGVNFQNLCNIVHYGPPRDLDTLVQQMGRAGRDGAMSHELIIFKSNQLRKVDDDILKLVKTSDECRRKILNDAYMQSYTKICQHLCCDVCELLCHCESVNCPTTHPSKDELDNISVTEEHQMRREVGAEEEAILKQRLMTLRDSFMEGMKTFIYGDIICGFNVDEIISNLPILFTVDDILDKTAIVSFSLADKIINIINEIFGDADMYMFVSQEADGSDSD